MPHVDAPLLAWILPCLLAGSWILLVARRRTPGARFFAPAVTASLACLAIGVIRSRTGQAATGCGRRPVMCLSDSVLAWSMNGLLGLGCCAVLLVLTAVLGLAVARPAVGGPIARSRDERDVGASTPSARNDRGRMTR